MIVTIKFLGVKREKMWGEVGTKWAFSNKDLTRFKCLSTKTLKMLCFIKLAYSGHSLYVRCMCVV